MFTYLNKDKNPSGFSLIEIMVSILILAIAFIGLIQSFPLGLAINKDAENSTIASYLAQDKVEELFSLAYENLSPGVIEAKHRISNDPNDYRYQYQRQTEITYLDANLNPAVNDLGMKKISTTVYYISPLSKVEKSYQLATIISQK